MPATRYGNPQFGPFRRWNLRRDTSSSTAKILKIHVYRRVGFSDVLLAVISRDPTATPTRTGGADGIYQWTGTGWTQIWQLPGTNLIYDTTTWRERVYFVDGRTEMLAYDGLGLCPVTSGPVVQYITSYQERLVGAGDNRTQSEVEADGGVWPVDSNRDRVLFCEPLDDTVWSPNNFIDASTGTGETVSGLGVNSINSADRGAQSQLVVFKPTSTLINDGVLGSGDQRLNHVSKAIGCPGYKTIKNTPYGLMFTSKHSTCLMDTSGKEPQQIGFAIHTAVEAIPDTTSPYTSARYGSAAIFHDNAYKLSIASSTIKNDREWLLDLRPGMFPDQANWYGAHIGDFILEYEYYQGQLIGAEQDTINVWVLDKEGQWGSMSDPSGARTSVMTWARFKVDNMKQEAVDAYGYSGQCATSVTITESVSLDRGTTVVANTFTTPVSLAADLPSYNVTRPLKNPAHDAQVSLTHNNASDIELHSLYLRSRTRGRQSEKQNNSGQA